MKQKLIHVVLHTDKDWHKELIPFIISVQKLMKINNLPVTETNIFSCITAIKVSTGIELSENDTKIIKRKLLEDTEFRILDSQK